MGTTGPEPICFTSDGKKRFLLQITIMLVQQVTTSHHKLHCNEFVSSLFEPLNDFCCEVSRNAIWFDHDKGAFCVVTCHLVVVVVVVVFVCVVCVGTMQLNISDYM